MTNQAANEKITQLFKSCPHTQTFIDTISKWNNKEIDAWSAWKTAQTKETDKEPKKSELKSYGFDSSERDKEEKNIAKQIVDWLEKNYPEMEGFEWSSQYKKYNDRYGVMLRIKEKATRIGWTGNLSWTSQNADRYTSEGSKKIIHLEDMIQISWENFVGELEKTTEQIAEIWRPNKLKVQSGEEIPKATMDKILELFKSSREPAEDDLKAIPNFKSYDKSSKTLQLGTGSSHIKTVNIKTGEVFDGDVELKPSGNTTTENLPNSETNPISGTSVGNSSSTLAGGTSGSNSSTEDYQRGNAKDPIIQNDKSHLNVTEDDVEKVMGVEFQGFMGNNEQVKKRQKMLDMNDYHTEYKNLNPNKMPNNLDPYPVDLKIEELETHAPNVKLYEVNCRVEAEEAAIAAMQVSNATEKRLVKLENLFATMMRLIFRIGARMPINCVYYGGQSVFEKYKCIRCMYDDRIQDGQMMQLDQCLYCTRYEPVYGQVYEILNEVGQNLAFILDDDQMGYRTVKDYVTDARSEKYHSESAKSEINMSAVQIRDVEEKDFEARWGKGLAMNWKYVPKEDQKAHINWRQSINDDGSNIGRLASFPKNEENVGANIINSNEISDAGVKIPTMEEQKTAMENYTRSENLVKEAIANGKSVIGGGNSGKIVSDETIAAKGILDDAKNKISADWQQDIKTALGDSTDVDMLTIGCICYFTNEKPADVVAKYKKIMDEVGTKNPAVVIAAYGCSDSKVIIGNEADNEIYKKENPEVAGDDSNSPDNKVEAAVLWAIKIAEDQTHGYSQGEASDSIYKGSRNGPDYDCSSLVYWALENGGFGIITKFGGKYKEAGNSSSLWGHLQQLGGWTKYSYSEYQTKLVRGDILCDPANHAAIYIGDNKTVEAHGISHGAPETGDQGTEIDYGEAQGRKFTEVYRYIQTGENTKSSSSSSTSSNKNNVNSKIETYVQWALGIAGDNSHGYSQRESASVIFSNDKNYQGSRNGPEYDCSSLVYYALDKAGFNIIANWRKNPEFQSMYQGKQAVGDAADIWQDLQGTGNWKKFSWSEVRNKLVRGDILCKPDSHCGIYIGDGKTVEAKGVNGPRGGDYRPGDQGGEIDIYDAQSYGWTEVYRYVGS